MRKEIRIFFRSKQRGDFVQKRQMGNLKENVGLLGFGCMRLPTLSNAEIDEEEAVRIVRYGIQHGVNYLDTAYNYHQGKSEEFVGRVVKDGYREKVNIATKLPVWLVNSFEDCEKIFNEQLTRLDVETVDYYLLHALNRETWLKSKKHGVLDFLETMQKQGKIKNIGFSFHDELEVFKEIVDGYAWDFCQIQLNYMDDFYQAGVEGLEYAASKGLGVIVMEPLRGGKLVHNVPPEVKEIFELSGQDRSLAEWAFKWVANFPEVSLILSGMGKFEEVAENIKVLDNATPNSLSAEELSLFKQAKKLYNERVKISCTDCKYCLPCPQNIEIPRIFDLYNTASIYNSFSSDGWQYKELIKKGHDGARCIECGQCEDVCPQNLKIIDTLKMAHTAFARDL